MFSEPLVVCKKWFRKAFPVTSIEHLLFDCQVNIFQSVFGTPHAKRPVCMPLSASSKCSATLFRKALARKQLKVIISGVPFRGVRGGESERGRIGNTLEEGPLPFWAHFREKPCSKRSIKNGH